jgi:hypothetical protein
MEIQLVELHFSQPPRCDYPAIKARAEVILGEELDAPNSLDAKQAFLLFHKNHLATFKEGQLPAQTAILAAHQPINIQCYSGDIQQSWSYRDCEETLRQSRHTLLVTEMMARQLRPQERVRLFHGVLQSVVELTNPDALVFKHSQQVVAPKAYLDAEAHSPIQKPGALNVRFFNISNSNGDKLMDTRGLNEIGLHDLQCHFRDLDPNDVCRVLYNSAHYIFEKGAVIESGNTIAGIDEDSKWVCQFEDSLIEPKRELLDLNPGLPYAAGNRC